MLPNEWLVEILPSQVASSWWIAIGLAPCCVSCRWSGLWACTRPCCQGPQVCTGPDQWMHCQCKMQLKCTTDNARPEVTPLVTLDRSCGPKNSFIHSEFWENSNGIRPGQAWLSNASHSTPWNLHGPPKTVNVNQKRLSFRSNWHSEANYSFQASCQLSFRKPWIQCFSHILSIKQKSAAVVAWAKPLINYIWYIGWWKLQLGLTRAFYLSHSDTLPHCWNLKLHQCAFAFNMLKRPPQPLRR